MLDILCVFGFFLCVLCCWCACLCERVFYLTHSFTAQSNTQHTVPVFIKKPFEYHFNRLIVCFYLFIRLFQVVNSAFQADSCVCFFVLCSRSPVLIGWPFFYAYNCCDFALQHHTPLPPALSFSFTHSTPFAWEFCRNILSRVYNDLSVTPRRQTISYCI